ncbi:MAG: hypothetical protein M1826_002243 [Phylliscum demangeonii]|nr:MAG: hypothetical protein M1826_002243 [Phylliscum demangeonii]
MHYLHLLLLWPMMGALARPVRENRTPGLLPGENAPDGKALVIEAPLWAGAAWALRQRVQGKLKTYEVKFRRPTWLKGGKFKPVPKAQLEALREAKTLKTAQAAAKIERAKAAQLAERAAIEEEYAAIWKDISLMTDDGMDIYYPCMEQRSAEVGLAMYGLQAISTVKQRVHQTGKTSEPVVDSSAADAAAATADATLQAKADSVSRHHGCKRDMEKKLKSLQKTKVKALQPKVKKVQEEALVPETAPQYPQVKVGSPQRASVPEKELVGAGAGGEKHAMRLDDPFHRAQRALDEAGQSAQRTVNHLEHDFNRMTPMQKVGTAAGIGLTAAAAVGAATLLAPEVLGAGVLGAAETAPQWAPALAGLK